jgi:hypothetical protein
MLESQPLDPDARAVLLEVLALLESIGSANDAEDHHYLDEAERIRREAADGIRALADENPVVESVLPTLAAELDSGHVLGFGWADLAARVRSHIRATCEVCAQLADEEHGFQKFGWPEGDIELPAAVGSLEVVSDLGQGGSRERTLMRCPVCGTRYLYTTDYEYLTNGTEDEQTLRRLADDEVAE